MPPTYYIARGEKIDGPFSLGQVEALQHAGAFDAESLISQDKTNWDYVRNVVRPRAARPGLSLAAFLLSGFGLVIMFWFLVGFDVGVTTAAGRIANLDLMYQRQLGVIVGGVLFLGGLLLAIFAHLVNAKAKR